MTKGKKTYQNGLLDDLLADISPKEQAKTDKKMMLAAKIANGIKANGLKKSEFAKKLGKQPSEISKWLSGTHNFTIETLMEIEFLLAIHLLDMKNWDSDEDYQKVEIQRNAETANSFTFSESLQDRNESTKNVPARLYKLTG